MKIALRLLIQNVTLLAVAGLLVRCSQPTETKTMFRLIGHEESGIGFVNRVEENDSVNIIDYEYVYNGGGVGIGDFNNDGLPDVYFSGNMTDGKLYINKGELKFIDATQASLIDTKGKWCSGVSVVDINQDGWADIYLSVSGPESFAKGNLLFINQGVNAEGAPTFMESATSYGLTGNGNTTHSVFFDFDKDGDLDVYMLIHHQTIGNPNAIRPKSQGMSSRSNDRLYRNDSRDGIFHFTNVTREAGIADDGNGLGVAVQDIDGDGWDDIYVSNDYLANDALYINRRDGTFENRISAYIKHQSYSAMGNDVADINNDGLADILVLDMLPAGNRERKLMLGGRNFDRLEMEVRGWYDRQYVRNTLQLNNGINSEGQLSFSEIGQLSGVSETHWSWSPLLVDYDNDGYRDLSITNGYPKDITNRDFVQYRGEVNNFSSPRELSQKLVGAVYKLPGLKAENYIFKNNGDLTFADKSKDWGFNTTSYSYGSACADFDMDGDLDIVINNLSDIAFLYENQFYQKDVNRDSVDHYLRIRLTGSTTNRDAIGAKVTMKSGGVLQYVENAPYRGYQSTVESTIHFGLGKLKTVDSLEIIWPDNRYQLLLHVKADQLLTVKYDSAAEFTPALKVLGKPLFREVTDSLLLDFKHEEDLYIDFKNQPLLPHMYSQNGPGIAVADVNGDGLEDFFVGGGFKQSGQFFIQQQNGKFLKKALEKEVKFEEDLGVLLFDADGDNDPDLYVVSGGSEFEKGSPYYQHRLYVNDGKGNFKKHTEALPTLRESGSSVVAADIDGDGDLDLFVGGRVRPNEFPLVPRSYLLVNTTKNSGHPEFQDQTQSMAPDLSNIGMVTSALWTDFNDDHKIDLIVAGEWMPVSFFQNTGGGHLVKINASLPEDVRNLSGWWNSISGGDFDNDGDIDYVVGNLGLNSRFKASPSAPLSVYGKDFDQNGNIDPVITYYQNGVEYPFALREDMISQMNVMRRKFKNHQEYAEADFSKVFSESELRDSYKAQCNTFQSGCIENAGLVNGVPQFKWRPLPIACQMAPVYGIIAGDFDEDANLDLVITGNFYSSEVTLGRYDASIGGYLKGDGDGNFEMVIPSKSGLFIDGDAKGLARLTLKDKSTLVLSTQNAGPLKAFVARDKRDNVYQPGFMDASVTLVTPDGSLRKKELYYGCSYLCQSSGAIKYSPDVTEIRIVDFSGKTRTIKLPGMIRKK